DACHTPARVHKTGRISQVSRQLQAGEAMEQIVVGMADCGIAAIPGQILVTFALGSCIGLAVYDAGVRVGGLLHYMLPDSAIDPARGKNNPYMFADTGIPLLVKEICGKGASTRNLVAYAAGGASIMDPNNVFDIGKRNYLALRKLLWKAGVLLTGEAVGGALSRTGAAGDRHRQSVAAGRRRPASAGGGVRPAGRSRARPRRDAGPRCAAECSRDIGPQRRRIWLTGY